MMRRSAMVLAVLTWGFWAAAQPVPPPFSYDLDGPCDDVDDEQRLRTGLVAARVISDVEAERAPATVLDALDDALTAYQIAYATCSDAERSQMLIERAAHFDELSAASADIDAAQDERLVAAYGDVLTAMRQGARYLRRVQPARIALQGFLADALQLSTTCRTLAKADADSTSCEHDLDALIDDFTTQLHATFAAYAVSADQYEQTIDDDARSREAATALIAQLAQASVETRALLAGEGVAEVLQVYGERLRGQAAAMDAKGTQLQSDLRGLSLHTNDATQRLISGVH